MKQTCIIAILSMGLLFGSCADDDINSEEKGSITIEFDNTAGDENLELNKEYTNSSGEAFRLTTFNYYISNIRLGNTNGTEYVIPQDSSYFLVTENDPSSQKIRINNIPAGDYNKITFLIGVDSLRSTMDVSRRPGVLDPAQGHDGMYWTWNSGYIFFKMEGTSPVAPADQENRFIFHIGGYGGYDSPTLNNIREATVGMESARAEVRANRSPEIHLHVDVLELFANPTTIRIAEHPLVMFSDYSTIIANNYVNMFKYDHVHN